MNPSRALACAPVEPTVSTKTRAGKAQTDHPAAAAVRPSSSTTRSSPAAGPQVAKASDTDQPGLVGLAFNPMVPPKAGPKPQPNASDHDLLGLAPLADFQPEVLYALPSTTTPAFSTPEELVANSAPFEASEALAAANVKLETAKSVLSLLDDDDPMHAAALAAVADRTAAVNKLSKKTPGPQLQLEQLRSARQAQKEAFTKWEEVAGEGKDKAIAKRDKHLKVIDEISSQLVERRKAVLAAFVTADAAWDKHQQARRARWQSLLDQFDSKIAQLELAPAATAADDATMQDTSTLALSPSLDPLVVARAEIAKSQLAVAAAEKARAAAEKDNEDLRKSCLQAQTVEFQLSDLPATLVEPQPDQWLQFHHLWASLVQLSHHEACTGSPTPVSFAQLQCGVVVPRLLLGDVIWSRAFPTVQPSEDVLLSPQLLKLLGISLEAHRDKLVADKARQSEAAASAASRVSDAVSLFKKRRRDPTLALSDAGC